MDKQGLVGKVIEVRGAKYYCVLLDESVIAFNQNDVFYINEGTIDEIVRVYDVNDNYLVPDLRKVLKLIWEKW